jgi:hypothetical protein
MRDYPVILLSGIPSTRKSSFATWARDAHGVAHIDAEQAVWSPDVQHLRKLWSADPMRIRSFVDALRAESRPFIFDWGFPVAFIHVAETFRDVGADPWWFDGNIGAARAAHAAGGKSLERFDKQVADIRAAWDAIRRVFPAEHVVGVLDAKGVYLPYDDLYTRIFDPGQPTPDRRS